MRFIESISEWVGSGITRLTILTEHGEGKIQVDLLENDSSYGHTAFIWDLYVREDCRGRGIAKQLMGYALQRAKDYGYTTATLEWELKDTIREIAWWYSRLGFEDKEFGNGCSLMVKDLTK